MKIPIKLLSINAKTPTSSPGNAGYDLYAAEAAVIFPGQRALIKTDIAMGIPAGFYGRISDRSGMAYKNGATCIGKIIDSVYRGNVGVILLNTDKHDSIIVKVGDRPAQIIFHKYEEAEFEEVSELGTTERGERGYGSSGGISIVSEKPVVTTSVGEITKSGAVFPHKTFLEIYDIIQPDEDTKLWATTERGFIEKLYNNGGFENLDMLFDYMELWMGDWSLQELKVISEKLGLPIGGEVVSG